jgi:hypothetical protein
MCAWNSKNKLHPKNGIIALGMEKKREGNNAKITNIQFKTKQNKAFMKHPSCDCNQIKGNIKSIEYREFNYCEMDENKQYVAPAIVSTMNKCKRNDFISKTSTQIPTYTENSNSSTLIPPMPQSPRKFFDKEAYKGAASDTKFNINAVETSPISTCITHQSVKDNEKKWFDSNVCTEPGGKNNDWMKSFSEAVKYGCKKRPSSSILAISTSDRAIINKAAKEYVSLNSKLVDVERMLRIKNEEVAHLVRQMNDIIICKIT